MANDKSISKRKQKKPSKRKMRTNHLLIIGIDKYENGIASLNNAIRDAKAFQKVLLEHYQFEEKNVTTLFNEEATRSNILQTFGNLLDQLTENDNLIFYYSGHGEQIQRGKGSLGYWIPADGILDKTWSYLTNEQIINLFKLSKAHHIFGIVDSCFSGALFETRNIGRSWEERINSYPSRWLLTAGRLEVVSDGSLGENSPFATSLLTYLKNTPDKAIWTSDLCNLVLRGMEFNTDKQTPRGEPLQDVGHYGGQFVFYKKGYQPIEEKELRQSSPPKASKNTKEPVDRSLSKEDKPKGIAEASPLLRSPHIKNSENVVHNSPITAGGNVHIGNIINTPSEEEDLDLGEGKLLHDIPAEMQVQKTAICKVRIAKDKKILLEDLQTTSKTEIKDLKKITEVMSVELLDISGGANFTIMGGTSEEQYIDQHSYTEWTFFVTPKRAGEHYLQLKISTIKIINDIDRKKDITLLETISVITDTATVSKIASTPVIAPKVIPELKDLSDVQTYLRALLKEDLKKALDAYDLIADGDNDIIQQLGAYNRNKQDFNKGTIGPEFRNRINARIRNALTDMIDELDNSKLHPDYITRLKGT